MEDRASSGIAIKGTQGARKRHQDRAVLDVDSQKLDVPKVHGALLGETLPGRIHLAIQHKWTATLLVFTVLAFITRFWQISEPPQVVFDEVHFGKFASQYLRRTYFFDVHPPFGKLLFAFVGWLVGYDGHFDFENIGDDYVENNVPWVSMRALPALLGALHVPLCVDLARCLGYSHASTILVGALILFETAFITQCRLILLDSALIFFITLSSYCWVRFYLERYNPFDRKWWGWLAATGVSMGCAMGVKMVGFLVVLLVGVGTVADLWRLLDWRRGLSTATFVAHFLARALCLIALPIAVYLFWFWIHFAVLTRSGPGDAFMSHKFQSELQGSGMSGKSLVIPYGANITIRHRDTSVFLHSHPDTYPLRYEDNRVSSQGQQVTGYPHRDENNVWRIEPVDLEHYSNGTKPHPDDLKEGIRYVRNGDIVRLLHHNTMSRLLTHDVASPTMSTNMEITTIPFLDDPKRYTETLWRIETDGSDEGAKIRTVTNYVKFVSVVYKVGLYSHSQALPTWAYGQQEVNGNKNMKDRGAQWFIDEVWPDSEDGDASSEPVEEEESGLKEQAIPHYSVIRLQSSLNGRWLHSDSEVYPFKYEDQRISSSGQRVALAEGDPANFTHWVIEPVGAPFLHAQPIHKDDVGRTRYLRDGDLVRIAHERTSTDVFTHDVASPNTNTNMEVSTASRGDDKHIKESVWRVEMFPTTYTDVWKRPPPYRLPTRKLVLRGSKFRLVNTQHNVALSTQDQPLPLSWGAGLVEVNGNKDVRDGGGNIWSIPEVVQMLSQPPQPDVDLPPKQKSGGDAKKTNSAILADAEPVPKMSFLAKFVELQSLMIQHNALLTKSHPYQSKPIAWLFLHRGISFWETKGPPTWRQIYLLGNPFGWWSHVLGIALFALVWILDKVLLRRGVDEVGGVNRRWADRALGFIFIGWGLHYLPFFLMGRALFLHHYLPALVFGYIGTGGMVDFCVNVVGRGPSRVYGEEGRKPSNEEIRREWEDSIVVEQVPFRERSKFYGGIPMDGDNWRSTWLSWLVVSLFIAILLVGFYLFMQFAYGLPIYDLDQVRSKKFLSSWDFQFI
ncbi:glycosyltransferase family 39 protein [Gonapodya prolifera JEL478]|uniref:dolichyl-phosphate-mannose--protein mannosyltransferase n=1 Tax=Gonapodya prolifera (strain JEL478) TaxID=1344416 RepID=A0A139A9Y6_GONPJ|nr:glycosyltransferase family 39 protein [Gonapodya prolifera JEL478]|eukprot:KXS13508.1 glycosyltransferase family 39 protein [Gonapodya prolifera JEL478]